MCNLITTINFISKWNGIRWCTIIISSIIYAVVLLNLLVARKKISLLSSRPWYKVHITGKLTKIYLCGLWIWREIFTVTFEHQQNFYCIFDIKRKLRVKKKHSKNSSYRIYLPNGINTTTADGEDLFIHIDVCVWVCIFDTPFTCCRYIFVYGKQFATNLSLFVDSSIYTNVIAVWKLANKYKLVNTKRRKPFRADNSFPPSNINKVTRFKIRLTCNMCKWLSHDQMNKF